MTHQRVDYDKIDGLRWSRLKALRISPLQFQHELENERDDARHFRIGRAMHALILEPEHFERDFAVYEGQRRGKAWEAFELANAGRDVITEAEAIAATGMAKAVRTHPIASKHLVTGTAEQVLTWIDADTGVKCKARVDMRNGHLVELKSAADIDPSRWPAQCARFGYFGQLAFYHDGVLASCGYDEGHELDPTQIVVQSDAPHDVVVYRVPPTTIELGRREYKRCLRRYVECRESGKWPGIGANEERTLVPPAWMEEELEAPITFGGISVFD